MNGVTMSDSVIMMLQRIYSVNIQNTLPMTPVCRDGVSRG